MALQMLPTPLPCGEMLFLSKWWRKALAYAQMSLSCPSSLDSQCKHETRKHNFTGCKTVLLVTAGMRKDRSVPYRGSRVTAFCLFSPSLIHFLKIKKWHLLTKLWVSFRNLIPQKSAQWTWWVAFQTLFLDTYEPSKINVDIYTQRTYLFEMSTYKQCS